MAITINAKGTSVPHFTIGKNGVTFYQGPDDPSLTYTINPGDYWLNSSNNSLNVWAGKAPFGSWSVPLLGNIQLSYDGNIHPYGTDLQLYTDYGYNVMISGQYWPTTVGSDGQVLTTIGTNAGGVGILSWETPHNYNIVEINNI